MLNELPVRMLHGVGETRAKAFLRLGIRTVEDLLYHFPRAYEPRGDTRPLSDARGEPYRSGAKMAAILTVVSEPRRARLRGRRTLFAFRATDGTDSCRISFFNQDYLRRVFVVGSAFRFYGRVEYRDGAYAMTSPAYEPFAESVPLRPLWPVYPLTQGLSSRIVSSLIDSILESATAEMLDVLPESIRLSERLCTIQFALREIHRPTDFRSLHIAKRRLAFDEFFLFVLRMGLAEDEILRRRPPRCVVSERDMQAFLDALPYRLTGAQTRAVGDIRRDMAGDSSMNRILTGDVGCGKTVCAAAAVYLAVKSGYQAAVMAPTGILAAQHAADLIPFFERFGVRAALLTGHTTAAQKRRIRAALAAEDPAERLGILIGTQALLSEGVRFASLALVVTDEQHRFGVQQRAVLFGRNRYAHRLVMSATPIPRTMALALYGNLNVSRIDEMPPGRQRVDTFVVDESYRARLDAFIRRQTREGGQAYVVCPSIEEPEEDEADLIPLSSDLEDFERRPARPVPAQPLKAAVTYAEEIAARLPDVRFGLIHGQLTQQEKDRVMGEFVKGSIQVLVSTTVIEVGVNVPNACLMIVENAERFGLSQLHQLRGRVGRGSRKSYCVLVRGGGGEAARARLNVLRATYDGYLIAEQDLTQRGPGDFLFPSEGAAIRQSGGFRLTGGWQDDDLMARAFRAARALLSRDPSLAGYRRLRERIERRYGPYLAELMN